MKEKSKGKYLEEMVVDSIGWNLLEFAVENLSSNGSKFQMFYNILNCLLFIENFQIFEKFYPLSYSFDIF